MTPADPRHKPDPRLQRLSEIADMVRDAHLARLSAAHQMREASLALLCALEPAVDLPEDPPELLAALRHQRWAEVRRLRLMQDITRQEEVIRQNRNDAARAFARARVVAQLLRQGGKA